MNVISPIVSDRSHALVEPNLHDGNLLGISLLDEKGKIELKTADVDGKRYRFILDGVSNFRATDFIEGNIIFDVIIVSSYRVKMAHVEPLVDPDPKGEIPEQYVRRLYEKVVNESLCVFELNPSWGCYLIAVAKNVSIFSE